VLSGFIWQDVFIVLLRTLQQFVDRLLVILGGQNRSWDFFRCPTNCAWSMAWNKVVILFFRTLQQFIDILLDIAGCRFLGNSWNDVFGRSRDFGDGFGREFRSGNRLWIVGIWPGMWWLWLRFGL
jgi:hypothetical protein